MIAENRITVENDEPKTNTMSDEDFDGSRNVRIRDYRAILSLEEYNDLVKQCNQFSSIERIAKRLLIYLPKEMPGQCAGNTLAAEILQSGIKAFKITEGDLPKKYQQFLWAVIMHLKVVGEFDVSSALSESDDGIYWDYMKESYTAWAQRLKVTKPLIERMVDNTNYSNKQTNAIGIVIAGKILDRNDWSFLGVPQPGVFCDEQDKQIIDRKILDTAMAS